MIDRVDSERLEKELGAAGPFTENATNAGRVVGSGLAWR
jgi:hypothetical protein